MSRELTAAELKRAMAGCFVMAAIFFVLLLLSGCGESSSGGKIIVPKPEQYQLMTTPGGYMVQMPRMTSLVSRDWIIMNEQHIYDVVMNWLDIRIEDTIAAHPDKLNARKIAEGKLYILHDDYMFPCASSSGMCYGRTDMKSYVEGVIYARWHGNEYPTFQTTYIRTKEDMYKWTGIQGWLTQGANYYASDLYPDGMGLLVIKHELEHCFYGEKYGHQAITEARE